MKKIMKKNIVLALMALHVSYTLPHGGGGFGGGFATGALVGGLTTAAITSANRAPASPEYYEARERAAQRAEMNKQLKRKRNELRKAEKRGDMTLAGKLKPEIKEIEEDLRSL